MSALGQKRTCAVHQPMSASPPKATSNATQGNVRFGSKADMCTAPADVRFTPSSDINCVFEPEADINLVDDLRQPMSWRLNRVALNARQTPASKGEQSDRHIGHNRPFTPKRAIRSRG